ncbi:hypothetical protein HU200_039874 [Digitaria exilis]|uniref:TF-B3 domain-containing protein n=1 Tax=Digitaria exilis TaxID=1010633 RepID=A0A835BLS0_9POAL|nr:hypothetical protein HU200_039874 [Digitaria exilis]
MVNLLQKWQEHYYWEHMDVTKIRFFKLITGDFTQGISIPEKFAKNFKGQTTGGFELKASSGKTWHINVDKRGDELFLTSEWEDFVKDHELQENDLLLFTCCGNSSFKVEIFEASGSEKVSSLFGNTISPDTCKHVNDTVRQHGKHQAVSDSEDTTTPSHLVGCPHNTSVSRKSSGKTKPSLASIQLKNPAFVTVLTEMHVQRRNNSLIIPCKFAADHLEEKTHEIILRRPNRKEKWRVSYYCSRYMRSFQNLAFFRFVCDNKLREGDICVFELMKGKMNVTMTVHVIRKANGRFVLRVPEKFVSNLDGQITKGLSLKAPNGETWLIEVAKNANEMLFMSGWGDFARAHELQENDILIFTRSGNYSFDVQIFDASGCEKVPCFFTSKKGPCVHKHFDGGGDRHAENCILSDSDDSRMPLRLIGSQNKASTSKKSGKTKPRKEPESPISSNYHIKPEPISDDEQSDDSLVDSKYYSRSASNLTSDERDQIFSLASIRPGNPAFVAILQKSHVEHKNSMLTIHHGFVADHLEGRSHDIQLLRPRRKEKWRVRYYHGGTTRGFNCCRWIKFIRDNRLRKDHICIFELMKGARRTTMVVHVLRKVDGRFVLLT